MIKLIASDLDGTLLLNGAQQLSNDTLELVRQLINKGIYFVSASGRQYANQKRLWKELSNNILFICENGALTMYHDNILTKTPMDRQIGIEIAKDIQNRDGCEVTINAKDTVFLCPKYDFIERHMKDTVKYNVTTISDFSQINEEILKIAVYEEKSISRSKDYFKSRWSDKVNTAVSGLEWLDFTHKDANKGNALAYIQQKLGVSPEETCVFGDNFNDIEMLQQAKYSYVMENASNEIKNYGAYTTPSVELVLKDILHRLDA